MSVTFSYNCVYNNITCVITLQRKIYIFLLKCDNTFETNRNLNRNYNFKFSINQYNNKYIYKNVNTKIIKYHRKQFNIFRPNYAPHTYTETQYICKYQDTDRTFSKWTENLNSFFCYCTNSNSNSWCPSSRPCWQTNYYCHSSHHDHQHTLEC